MASELMSETHCTNIEGELKINLLLINCKQRFVTLLISRINICKAQYTHFCNIPVKDNDLQPLRAVKRYCILKNETRTVETRCGTSEVSRFTGMRSRCSWSTRYWVPEMFLEPFK